MHNRGKYSIKALMKNIHIVEGKFRDYIIRHYVKGGAITLGKLSRFIESIAVALVKDLVKSLLVLIFTSGIFGFAAHFASANLLYLSQYSVWFGMIFASGAGLISLYIYSRCSERIPKFKNMDFQYKVLHKEYTYEYLSKTSMKFKKYIKLKLLSTILTGSMTGFAGRAAATSASIP